MKIAGVADTHAALWYLFGDARLSTTGKAFIDHAASVGSKIGVSSISLAELVYLVEKGRLAVGAYDEVTQALSDAHHVFTEIALIAAVVEAMRRVARDEVPDMPDRIIAASALHLNVPVISRDRRIRSANIHTIW